jgi:hypothetical protein
MINREQYELITSGGGGGGSATAANQTTQITEAQTTNNKIDTTNTSLSNLGIICSNIQTETAATANYLQQIRTPQILSTSASGTIAPQIHNISFYNSGSAVGTITVNGTTINLPVGVTINYNAGGNNNRYNNSIFSYNATGTTFIIAYTQ